MIDINTCFETTSYYHTLAYYSHLVPVFIALFLSFYVFWKTEYSKISRIFLLFTLSFSLWLVGDVIIWTTQKYFTIYFIWSWLDYVNTVFFVLGSYFFGVLVRGEVSKLEKIIFLALCVPAFVLTLSGNSVTSFIQPWCEAEENTVITFYKLFAEWVAVASILYSAFIAWKKSKKINRLQIVTISFSILLFFSVFSLTEYIAVRTNIYEVNLYGLFILPLFLALVVFSITNLQVFNLRFLGIQILVYLLIIMVASQLLFIQDVTDRFLSILTIISTVLFGYLLLRNTAREIQTRIEIERLSKELKIANKSQEELLHFITHQIKGFLTKSRNIFAEMMEGTFGPISGDVKNIAEQGLKINTDGVNTVQTILNAANIRTGKLSYNMSPIDLRNVIQKSFEKNRKSAESKSLDFVLNIDETSEYKIKGDENQLLEAFSNLIDNSIKYTPKGEVRVSLVKSDNKIQFSVKDTGIGIAPEDKSKLFTEGGRGKNTLEVNVDSTGFGLYIVKNIIEAHNGRVWVESEGEGKGSEFIVEVPTSA